jgi:hypothetical protein
MGVGERSESNLDCIKSTHLLGFGDRAMIKRILSLNSAGRKL